MQCAQCAQTDRPLPQRTIGLWPRAAAVGCEALQQGQICTLRASSPASRGEVLLRVPDHMVGRPYATKDV
ncbi:hypothetical protein UB46_22845 [Burkholderiaceae bacterium 16]|nr:hypothetical protein UB46_22845 [Burkholderiaceae bacterium 16]